uniref:Discs, large homolog 4b (Drosophila) n=1 Tax=Salmo trutta TaxID=8032 RepID=A0A674D4M3_SALTR
MASISCFCSVSQNGARKESISYTERALQVIEASQMGDEGFKNRAEQLLNIFQSDLFQALLGETH